MSSTKFKITVPLSELRLDYTLQGGQSFRWFEIKPQKWRGVIGTQIWTLHRDGELLHCDVISENGQQKFENKASKSKCSGLENIIRNYLRLDSSLCELYKSWSLNDQNFASLSKNFTGIRILNQDPIENIFSFICSSNNNIERITNLVNLLCHEFGSLIATVDDQKMFTFPAVENLAVPGTEEKLRKLGFGYRAKYIETSAKMILEKGGESWLHGLKQLSYKKCHSEIMHLSGVGPKVADCICLMSMNHLSAIPVDTHVFQIATRDYLPHLKGKKSLTPKVYSDIGDHFRNLFGTYAGWAHSVLFTADLKKFKMVEKPAESKSKKRKKCNED